MKKGKNRIEPSFLMSKVRQSGTELELRVQKILNDLGVSFTVTDRSLPGTPDISNAEEKWAIFVHGCFWHYHAYCSHGSIPKTNRKYWSSKLKANRHRDTSNLLRIRRKGIRPLVIWECDFSDPTLLNNRIENFLALRNEIHG